MGLFILKSHHKFIIYCRSFTAYATSSSRWGHVIMNKNSSDLSLCAWTLRDMKDIVQSPTSAEMYPQLTSVNMIFSDSQTWPVVSKEFFPEYWPEPSADEWSDVAWADLLQAVIVTFVPNVIGIWVPTTVPLSGLLSCLSMQDLKQCKNIFVYHGLSTMEDLEVWHRKYPQIRGKVVLVNTHIIVPEGEKVKLHFRRHNLLWPGNYIFIMTPSWRTETGEEYVWTDD